MSWLKLRAKRLEASTPETFSLEAYQSSRLDEFLFKIDEALGLFRDNEGVVFDEKGNLFLRESIHYESLSQKIDELSEEKNQELFVYLWRIPEIIRGLKIPPTATSSDIQNGYLIVFKHDDAVGYSAKSERGSIPEAKGKLVLEKINNE